MLCPECYGSGWIITGTLKLPSATKGDTYGKPCDYPGCHNGHIQCCEGDVLDRDHTGN